MVQDEVHSAETMDIYKEMREEQRLAMESVKLAYQAGDSAAVDILLSMFPAQEEEVVRLRWGLGRAPLRTLREIGEIMGLSGSRVSQIDHKARRRLSSCLRTIGPIGSIELERYALAVRNRHLENEDCIRKRAAEKVAAAERRQKEKAERHEARRAKARAKHWQRRIDRATAERDGTAKVRALLSERILRIERRGWMAKTFLPHRSILARLRSELVDLDAKILEQDAAIAKIKTSQLLDPAPAQ